MKEIKANLILVLYLKQVPTEVKEQNPGPEVKSHATQIQQRPSYDTNRKPLPLRRYLSTARQLTGESVQRYSLKWLVQGVIPIWTLEPYCLLSPSTIYMTGGCSELEYNDTSDAMG